MTIFFRHLKPYYIWSLMALTFKGNVACGLAHM